MKFRPLFIILLLLIFVGCTKKAAFTGTPFERPTTTRALGFSEDSLQSLSQYIDKNANTTGMVALYNGRMIYQYGDIEKISYIASCRKSVLSMLFGKYVEDGTIDLQETIGDLGIDEKDGLLPKEKEATVDHIITSRSGVFHKPSNAGYDKDNIQKRGTVEPGEYWVYNNWDFNAAGAILEKYTGRSIYEDMEQQLAIPLGFQDWNIENQKKSGAKRKSQYLAYHMYLSTRDMAKIGQLMLNEGEWNGEQLIPEEWVRKTTTTVTPLDTLIARFGPADPTQPYMSYGYMWWLIDKYLDNPEYQGAYTAIGYGGQFITVIPEVNMVIAHKTKLNLPTLIGISYKATEGDVYWKIVDKLVNARIDN